MVDDATHGLMLWDGKSKGTLNSVVNMIRQQKPVVVYLAPMNTFQRVRSARDVMDLMSRCDPASIQRFEQELGIERAPHRAPVMSNGAKGDTRRGRRRPGWKQELTRSLQKAAAGLPNLSDDEIVKLVRTYRRESTSARKS